MMLHNKTFIKYYILKELTLKLVDKVVSTTLRDDTRCTLLKMIVIVSLLVLLDFSVPTSHMRKIHLHNSMSILIISGIFTYGLNIITT